MCLRLSSLAFDPQAAAFRLTAHAAQALHTSFLKSVNETSKEITSFKEAYTADKTKSIIQKADGSRRMNIKGIVPWVPSEHPDWTTPKVKRESANQTSTGAGK
jgi:hypothetical protein